LIQKIVHIIVKEFQIELKRLHILSGIVLFSVILVYLIYKSFNRVEGLNWAVLLWIVVLFSGINAVSKSFTSDSDSSRLYYYALFDPFHILIARLIYNFLFVGFLVILTYLGFTILLGNALKDISLFAIGAILGSLGLSIVFTTISSISSQGGNQSVMMSVMSIPLTIPITLLLIKITAVALRLIQDSSINDDIFMLSGINMLLGGVIFFIFPELWKD
jgi:heme exporter protein B